MQLNDEFALVKAIDYHDNTHYAVVSAPYSSKHSLHMHPCTDVCYLDVNRFVVVEKGGVDACLYTSTPEGQMECVSLATSLQRRVLNVFTSPVKGVVLYVFEGEG